VNAALQFTQGKPLFLFYKSAILFRLQQVTEAIVQLEKAMEKSPKMLKNFIEMNPSILQNQQVVDLLARFKRRKSI
jgi:hypothetical protein